MSVEPPAGGGGRRVNPPEARSGGWRWPAAAVLVLAVAAGLLTWAAGRSPTPPSSATAAREVPVDAASLTCRGTGGSPTTVLSTLVAGGAGTPDADADLSATTLDSGMGRAAVLPVTAGELTSAVLAAGVPGVQLEARGPAAVALQAWTSASAARADGAGLAVAPCARPGSDRWFVGAGSTLEQDGTILLANPAGTSAVADVSFLTADGELRPAATQGLVLEPGAGLQLELAEMIAGSADVAVRVQSREGQVAAAVLDRWTEDRRPAGTEWIPLAGQPETRALLPGLPTRVAAQRLVVANPGDLGAVMSVQVVGPGTTYVPEGLREVTVPAGTTTSVPLPAGLDGQVVSLLTESDRPVLSSVRSTSRGPGADIAYATGAPDLSGATAVPLAVPPGGPPGATRQLFAFVATGSAAGTVRMSARDASGDEVSALDLDVPAGGTTVADLSGRGDDLDLAPREAAEVVQVVLEVTGGVGAALVHTQRSGSLSVLPVVPVPATVIAPDVLPDGLIPRR